MDDIIYQLTNSKAWMKPIEKKSIINENYFGYVHMIVKEIVDSYYNTMNRIINDIIHQEYAKRPKSTLKQRLLIKNQITNNFIENMNSLAHNIAAEMYINNNEEEPFVNFNNNN
jgi:hypothetical protein